MPGSFALLRLTNDRVRLRTFFEAQGLLIQEWDRVRADWLTVTPNPAQGEVHNARFGNVTVP